MTTTALPLAGPQPPRPRRAEEGVLADIRSARAAATAWEVETARLIIGWIQGHRVPDRLVEDGPLSDDVIGLAGGVGRPAIPGTQAPMRLAGPGAPVVWDLAFCELATSVAMSLDAARGYVGELTELYFRLPELWSRVDSGQVRLWRAREVARNTTLLCADGAAWVDAQLASTIGSCSGAQLRRTITAALQRFDPETAEAERVEAADGRHFSVLLDGVAEPELPGSAGVVSVEGILDIADAVDLDAAVTAAAAHLGACGSTDSRNVRRARALGEIARTEAPLPWPEAEPAPAAAEPATHRSGRSLELILHLGASTPGDKFEANAIGRCENTRSPVLAEQIRSWCGTPGTRVTVRPVIDLAGHYAAETYEIPPRLRDQVRIREPQCVFPSCTRRARRADLDHIVPYELGGPTCGCNLAPLCRRHHRAKTHADWTYVMVTPGSYLWTSPSGKQSLVDGRGTFRVPAVGEVCAHAQRRDRDEPPPWSASPPRPDSPAPPTPSPEPERVDLGPPPF